MESHVYDNGPFTDGENDGDEGDDRADNEGENVGDDEAEHQEADECDDVDNNETAGNNAEEQDLNENVHEVVHVLVNMQENPVVIENNDQEDSYTLNRVQTPPQKMNLDEDDDVDNENVDWRDFEMGTQTQEMFEYCNTQPQLSNVEYDKEQYETSVKAKKNWMRRMDKNIKRYQKIKKEIEEIENEMEEMVDHARSKYFWVSELVERCKLWDEISNKTSKENNGDIPEDVQHEEQNEVDADGQDEVDGDAQEVIGLQDEVQTEVVEGGNVVVDDISNMVDNIMAEDVVDKGNPVSQEEDITDTAIDMIQTIEPGVYGVKAAEDASNIVEEQPEEDNEQLDLDSVLAIVPFVQPETPKAQSIHKGKGKGKANGGRPNRQKKPSRALRSPYVGRNVCMVETLTSDELLITQYMMAPIKDKLKIVYRSPAGTETPKVIFESFHPGIWLHTNALDLWTEVLNYEEKKRNDGSKYRLFCTTTMMPDEYYKEGKCWAHRHEIFKSNLEDLMRKFEVKSLDDFDMILVPLLISNHFYVMSFDVKNGVVELIDNSMDEPDFEKRYQGVPEVLRHTLCHSLMTSCERSEGITRLEISTIIRRQMPWRTTINKVDCGIFTMRHMETFKGHKNWNCGFACESNLQQQQLDALRFKYLAKIILSDHNTLRDEVIEAAHKFDKVPYKKKMMENAYGKLLKRLDKI